MVRTLIVFIHALLFITLNFAQKQDSLMIRKIFDVELTQGKCYERLGYLCNEIGSRLSGSPGAEKAVEWTFKEMNAMGLDNVFKMPVMVPHWVRGEKETGKIFADGTETPVNVCALGGSIGTGDKGILAEIVEVKSLDEVKQLGAEKLRGKIVFYNRPMDPTFVNTFHSYGGCVDQRSTGAIEAGRVGALAVIVRSMTLSLDDYPHTGAMKYEDGVKKIPAAAISTNGAELLSATLRQNPSAQFFLRMTCETLPDVMSANVIGEIRGTEFPDEYIVVGGHLDCWDLGVGAHDDGAGCMQAMEVLQIMKNMGYKPKRTIRAVMFMNEENGMKGGIKYGEESRKNGWVHVAALESDRGGFAPRGFTIDGVKTQIESIKPWEKLFQPYYADQIVAGYGGVDISPLKKDGTALIGFEPDSQRYFDFHHCERDTFDGVHKRELELGAATMAALIYLVDQYSVPRSIPVPAAD